MVLDDRGHLLAFGGDGQNARWNDTWTADLRAVPGFSTFGSGCGLSVNQTAPAVIATSFGARIQGLTLGGRSCLPVFGTVRQNPPLPIPGSNCLIDVAPRFVLDPLLSLGGSANLTLPIPNDSNLVGACLIYTARCV